MTISKSFGFLSKKNFPNQIKYLVDYVKICDSFDSCDKYIKNYSK